MAIDKKFTGMHSAGMHSIFNGKNSRMDLRFSPIKGIVEVMDEQHQKARSTSLSGALTRLSTARQLRGSVGILDPFEAQPVEDHLAYSSPIRTAHHRRGLFKFSDRARQSSTE